MFFVWPDKEEFPQIQFLKEKMTLPGQNSALRAYQQHFYTTANITDILNLKLYKVSKPINKWESMDDLKSSLISDDWLNKEQSP